MTTTATTTATTNSSNNMGINCDTEHLKDGSCNMSVYKVFWGSVNPKSTDLKSFSTDLFTWATMFIGFVVFVAIAYSGFLMITWWIDEKQFETWKKWLIYSLIWLFLVGWSYGIIKLIQLVASWQ